MKIKNTIPVFIYTEGGELDENMRQCMTVLAALGDGRFAAISSRTQVVRWWTRCMIRETRMPKIHRHVHNIVHSRNY